MVKEPGIDELKAQRDELKEQDLRVLAEMENMKKRQQRQYEEVIKYGKESILKDFLLIFLWRHKSEENPSGSILSHIL